MDTLFPLPPKPKPNDKGLKFTSKSTKELSLNIKDARAKIIWPSNYTVCKDTTDLGRLAAGIARHRQFAFDTETSGVNPHKDKCYCVSFSVGGNGYLVNFDHPMLPQTDPALFRSLFSDYFIDDSITKVGFNIKFDATILSKDKGVNIGYMHHDAYIASWLHVPQLKKGQRKLKRLCQTYLAYPKLETYEEKFGKHSFIYVDPRLGAFYAIQDAMLHNELHLYFQKALHLIPALESLYNKIEIPVTNEDFSIEHEGFDVDEIYLRQELSAKLEDEIGASVRKLHELGVPEKTNIDSPQSLGKFLFDDLKLPRIEGDSTGIDVLNELKDRSEIAEELITWRQLTKLKTAFVDSLGNLLINGKIHPQNLTTGTSTGRGACEKPNLQNLPEKVGPTLRRAFIAKKGYVIVSKDYSGQELRIMSHFAGPGPLRKILEENGDVYAETAEVFYHVPAKELHKGDIRRDTGKKAWLARQYLCQAGKLAKIFNCPLQEGKSFVQGFDRKFYDLASYTKNVLNFLNKNGYVQGILGRRRYFDLSPDVPLMKKWASEREANNMPIQNTGAEMLKIAFIKCRRYLRENCPRSQAKLRVHDEILFWIHEDDWCMDLHYALNHLMENALVLDVPAVITTKVYMPGKDGVSRWGENELEIK